MATITLKGNEIHTSGNLPEIGSAAPDFTLVKTDLSTTSLGDYKGSKVILNIFLSIDTSTCGASVRKFNQEAAALDNTKVLCISRDLPFAQARFCGAEGIENVTTISDFVDGSFGKAYGLDFIDGPLKGLNSRSIVVMDEDGKVLHTEQVSETGEEPNYEKAIAAIN
ncbi:MAG: thiol peroxidase [Reichenbachiella sp.]